VNCARKHTLALPALRRARGRIVMISTIGVRFSPPFAGPLDAAKAALTALGEALRQELAPWGVRVVLVEPATINSGAADKVTRDAAAAPRPRAVYLCGKDSRRLAVLSGLPAPVLDLARRRIFRLPAPGSLAS
jgi:NAD(P)-dependent dehydrogenase (short-subunit alcohol dehydrogenase family)